MKIFTGDSVTVTKMDLRVEVPAKVDFPMIASRNT